MDNVSVSVIVPVYNSEDYVGDVIESILSQDLEGFELLLIDDGSQDRSGAICDSYSQADGRVRVVHRENGGMCSARNEALRIARGEYIAFADNDDLMLGGALSSNYRLAKRYDADCVRFGRRLEMTDEAGHQIYSSTVCPKELTIVSEEELASSYRQLLYCEGVWTGLFRRSTLLENDVTFDERLRHGGEDRLFIVHFYNHVKTVVLNPKVCYVWQRRVGHSSSVSLDENKLLGLELSTRAEHDLMDRWNVKLLDPSFYGERMLSSLMVSLRDCAYAPILASKADFGQFLNAMRRLYEPYQEELKGVPMGLVSKVVYRSLMRGIYFPASLYVALVRRQVKASRPKA